MIFLILIATLLFLSSIPGTIGKLIALDSRTKEMLDFFFFFFFSVIFFSFESFYLLFANQLPIKKPKSV